MGYDYGVSESIASIYGAMFGIIIIGFAIGLAVMIVQITAFWKIYKKAGKEGWESIVPFYNNWVLVEISGLNWWWFLFFLAPLVLSCIDELYWLGCLASIFVTFNYSYNLSKKFHKGVGFAICMTLFTPICACILGFSKKNVYDASVVVSSNGVIPGKNISNNSVSNNAQNNVQYQPNYNQPMNNQPATPVTPQPVFNNNCSRCGASVNAGDKFCMNCGNQL